METIATEVVDKGEKKDACGRRIVRLEEREALIGAYERSGLTQKAFARREGIKFCTFTAWLARRRRKPVFAEVNLPRLGTSFLEVALPEGLTVRGSEVEQVALLVGKLRRC